MKIRSSTKIALGFAVLVTAGFGGYKLMMARAIEGATFAPVVPGDVNLVGIAPGSGYRIIVANYVAQLVQANENADSNGSGDEGPTEGAIKKRIPIKEMLAVLRGDANALGPLTMSMNDMKEEELPPIRVIWTAENLKKACAGDAALKSKLEQDLNVHLDGRPMDKVRPSSIENGIVIDVPVKVKVNLGGQMKDVVGHVLDPFKPRLIQTVERHYADKAYTSTTQAGYYKEEAEPVLADPAKREDVKSALLDRISDSHTRSLADPVERILASATVIVNQSHIKDASFRTYDTSDGPRNDLTIEMTEEGRKRLWKYSHENHVGSQILVVADGVAIEAPRIRHELSEGELTITQMRDKTLVQDAVNMIKRHAKPQ